MIEKTIRNHLRHLLNDPVYLDVPANPPARYYKLEKTGSGEEDHICTATFALQSHAPTLLEALKMNYAGIAAMKKAVRLRVISDVKFDGDYNFTDTTRKLHRYQAVFHITHYLRSETNG